MTMTATSALDALRVTYPGRVLLTIDETAEVLLTTVSALRARIHRGQIPITRIGGSTFVPLTGLAELIDAGTTTP